MIISIGGNIGSGKSTMIRYLEKHRTDIQCITEPIHKWGEWMQLFYSNPTKYAFGFQMKILDSFQYLDADNDNNIYVTERSPWESNHIFAKLLLEQGILSEVEYDLYNTYHLKYAWKPHVYIYINTSYNECISRMRLRNRKEEENINHEYVKELDEQYNKVFTMSQIPDTFIEFSPTIYSYDVLENTHVSNNLEVYEIDGNRPVDDVFEDVNTVLNRMLL